MDAFNSKEFYGHSLSNDPKLRTTTTNYEFKYNCSEHLEKIINRVKMDREKKNQSDLLTRHCILPSIKKLCAPYSKGNESQLFRATSIETQIERSSSRETVVKIMSDDEIEAMIKQVMHTTNNLPSTTEIPRSNKRQIQLVVPESKDKEVPLRVHPVEAKVLQCFLEVQPALQPQWVEIKPTEKASASVVDIYTTSHTDVITESQECSAVNLASENLVNDTIEIEKATTEERFSDVLSFDSSMSDDFVIRQEESAHQKEAESPPDSPSSFGIESPLNDCERAEMERVLGKVLPHVPEMEFSSLGSQEDSEINDEHDEVEESQDDATSCEFIEPHLQQPFVRINQHEHIFKQTQEPDELSSRSLPRTPKSLHITFRSPKVQTATSSKGRPQTPLDVRMQKQVEALKREKTRIFSKMTSIQEQIIESLDKLRMSLVELALPDGNAERKLRERNAFEFSVRFSRNYLFPLGRMIEDLRISPAEDYRSATTNEPCIKVCGIYGLLNQALQCYHKQLRHFFIDSVPKKLDILLNMIKDTTKVCLKKKIFDKRDSLIQCLLSRCTLFLEFVLAFAEHKSARDMEVPIKSVRKDHLKLSKTSSKWDLTMNLNNLNMYEPKLVPKKPKTKHQKKTTPLVSSREKSKERNKTPVVSKHLKDYIALPKPDPVDTQVQKIDNSESMQIINTIIEEQPDNELTKTVIETLQDITKDEVHQMLGPLVSNLDIILRNPDNPQAVESMLGALNLQLLEKYKQLKIDAAATENNTQNGNTYQKEVTKKGADSGKDERRKETRQKRRRVSKTNTTSSCSNNFNEGSTKQTEIQNSPGGRTDTICDKQSLSNTDDVAVVVDKNVSTKHKTRSSSVVHHGGAFLSPVAVTAKKPTPAPTAIGIGIPPPSLAAVSPVQLDEVMSRPLSTPRKRMTSLRVTHSNSLPLVVPMEDKFASECQRIGDGSGYPKGYRTQIASQEKVRDGAANAFDGEAEDNQEACQGNPQSSSLPPLLTKNRPTMSGQIEQLKYCSNAMYTFVKCCEDDLPSPEDEQDGTHENGNIPDEECFTESCTKLTSFSPKPSQDESFKSVVDSNQNLLSDAQKQIDEEMKNEEDVKALLQERTNFIEQCKDDPLYTNPQFPEPWKVLSKISRSITREIIGSFENDLSFGEESYIRDFINMEMQT